MTRRSLAAIAGLLLAALAIGACQGASGARVRLENQTNVPVAVHVNDAWVGTHAPGTVAEFAIPGGADRYDIQARSPSGAVLVSILGTAAMIESAQAGELPVGEWADLPCGAIALSIGWSRGTARHRLTRPRQSVPLSRWRRGIDAGWHVLRRTLRPRPPERPRRSP